MIRPLLFSYPYAVIFGAVFVVNFLQERRRFVRQQAREGAGESLQDQGSKGLMIQGIQFASGLAVLLALFVPSATILPGHQEKVFWTGIGLMLSSMILREHCFRMLGDHFNPIVSVQARQPIIKRGAYKWVRHPSYLGVLLMYAGVGLALTNWFSVLAYLVITAAVLGRRIQVEENIMLETLGTPYRDYMRRTKRLVPLIF